MELNLPYFSRISKVSLKAFFWRSVTFWNKSIGAFLNTAILTSSRQGSIAIYSVYLHNLHYLLLFNSYHIHLNPHYHLTVNPILIDPRTLYLVNSRIKTYDMIIICFSLKYYFILLFDYSFFYFLFVIHSQSLSLLVLS